jgi:uncharacterized protein GlcG (DUF336 family)
MHKLMNKDKIILRFTARMARTATHALSRADAERSFVLSYFMMDDSVLIVRGGGGGVGWGGVGWGGVGVSGGG